jgi:hypothetical protein
MKTEDPVEFIRSIDPTGSDVASTFFDRRGKSSVKRYSMILRIDGEDLPVPARRAQAEGDSRVLSAGLSSPTASWTSTGTSSRLGDARLHETS